MSSGAEEVVSRTLPRSESTGVDPSRRWRALRIAVTLGCAPVAAVLAWVAWDQWLALPWTRDGRVRVYVVSMAPEVAGRVVEMRVRDNQFVHKGDVLVVVDPADYAIAVSADEAMLQKATVEARNKQQEADRRRILTTLSTSQEEKQTFASDAVQADASVRQARAQLAQARVNLERTQMRSPVNGWVTNLQVRIGDFAAVGQRDIAVVDADSFWVDAYFEETALARIREGDPARLRLMGYRQTLRGHVDGVAHGVQVANAQSDPAGLAMVNPIFTWVRLAQRVPVRIEFDGLPEGVRLVAGTTATVEVVTSAGGEKR